MTVHVSCEHPRGRAAAARLKRRAGAFLRALGLEGRELSIVLVGDRAIRRLNRTWRGKDVATDVLSFPAGPGAGPLLGDVVLSLDTAARVAGPDGLAAELDRYLAHGILHLLGFDHHRRADAERMGAEEERLLGGGGMILGPASRSRSQSQSQSRRARRERPRRPFVPSLSKHERPRSRS